MPGSSGLATTRGTWRATPPPPASSPPPWGRPRAPFDRGVAALIEDLHARGLADDVLLIVTGEFGRTPRVGQRTTVANATSTGRDHWGGVFTTLVCGGGTRPGLVVGASDKI